ncbi:MAG TPA: 50S ribosomal protein L10 [Terriglobia bacterium]|nr:50S ribosomal protein L10 [Terriglobia bacterium]
MKKDAKQQKAEELHRELAEARSVILSGFEGITVSQDFELRRKVEATGAKYRVAKNSIIERAAKDTTAGPAAEKLRGTTSLAYTSADPVALAKVLSAFAKDNAVLVFKAGVVEGRVIDLKDLTALATLPSQKELFAKVLFLINSPAQGVAAAISAVGRDLARVIQQGVKENKFQEAPGQ